MSETRNQDRAVEPGDKPSEPRETGSGNGEPEIKVTDRRHWARDGHDDAEPGSEAAGEETSRFPTMIDEYRERAEAAERKLQEYIEAFKEARDEQERVRARLQRDVERRAELRFADLLGELLESVDDLELALEHAREVPQAESLARGVELARERFLAALGRAGVESIRPDGDEFDPNVAEAVQLEPVGDAERDGKVTSTLRPGYRLGDRIVRPARVIVGKAAE